MRIQHSLDEQQVFKIEWQVEDEKTFIIYVQLQYKIPVYPGSDKYVVIYLMFIFFSLYTSLLVIYLKDICIVWVYLHIGKLLLNEINFTTNGLVVW